jgi:hypothetical protein
MRIGAILKEVLIRNSIKLDLEHVFNSLAASDRNSPGRRH